MDDDLNLAAWMDMFPTLEMNLAAAQVSLRAKTPALKPVTQSFFFSCNRVLFLGHLVRASFDAGRIFQLAESAACIELGKDPVTFAQAGMCKSVTSDIEEARNRILQPGSPSSFRPEVFTSPEWLVSRSRAHGFHADIDLLMSMQLVAVWTICETLFGDLWEAALNAHPKTLAELKSGERVVTTRLLQKHGYDLRNKMGTLLRGKVNFQTLAGTIDAYEAAFSEHGKSIHDTIKHEAFRGLAEMRNLIVHRSGICDEKYQKAAKSLPALPQLSVGQALRFDGVTIAAIVVPSIRNCCQLLQDVDAWIVNHP
jgi:hypothetical protein